PAPDERAHGGGDGGGGEAALTEGGEGGGGSPWGSPMGCPLRLQFVTSASLQCRESLTLRWPLLVLRLGSHPLAHHFDVPYRPYLHTARVHPGKMRGDAHGLAHVLSFDEVEATQHFLRLGERTIGGREPPVPHAHGFRRRRVLEHLRLEKLSFLPETIRMRETIAHGRIELPIGQRVQSLRVVVDEKDKFHDDLAQIDFT